MVRAEMVHELYSWPIGTRILFSASALSLPGRDVANLEVCSRQQAPPGRQQAMWCNTALSWCTPALNKSSSRMVFITSAGRLQFNSTIQDCCIFHNMDVWPPFRLTGMHKPRLQESRMKGSNGIWELPITPYGMY